MVKAVIGAAIIYYLQLEYWWWILFVVAVVLDLSNDYANNTNSSNTVNELVDIKEILASIELKQQKKG